MHDRKCIHYMIVHGHTKWSLVNWRHARISWKKNHNWFLTKLHCWLGADLPLALANLPCVLDLLHTRRGDSSTSKPTHALTKKSTIRKRQPLVRRARFVRGNLRSCSLFTPQTIWIFRLVSSNILELILTIRSFAVREFIFSCMLWLKYSKCDIYRRCKASHFLHE